MLAIGSAGGWSYTDIMTVMMGSVMMVLLFRMLVAVLKPLIRIEDEK